MRILVTFAVDAEFAPWRELRPFKKITANPNHYSGGREVYEATVDDATVWVFFTGIGIRAFDFEAEMCFLDAGIDTVISSGLAGALSQECALGQIIAPERIGTLRDAAGVETTRTLVQLAKQKGATAIRTLLTADHIIDTREEKKRLSQFAAAVDMESFHVLEAFQKNQIPSAAIRAISDASDEDLPVDFAKVVTPAGKVKPGPLLRELWASPGKIQNFVRFGKQSRNSARQLVKFLDGFVEALRIQTLKSDVAEGAAR